MPRKGAAPKRIILPDPVYGSEMIQRFINRMMLDGKKSTAEKIFYTALNRAAEKVGEEPINVFDRALHNAMPQVEVRPRRVGGQTYQVPMEVRPERRRTLALR
ncbi:MAG: 30S ribosomal protein S7, partial [Fimbriimonadaceae bacterium]|nr:30S ribosomal protein S7 [Fimbriimonadaceae bacterium]